jgi:hypothetical protein
MNDLFMELKKVLTSTINRSEKRNLLLSSLERTMFHFKVGFECLNESSLKEVF